VRKNEIMERAKFVKQGGVMILNINLSEIGLEEIREVVEYSKGMIGRMPKGSVLTITDVSGVNFEDGFKEIVTGFLEHNKPFVRAGAVLGVSGWKKLVYLVSSRLSGRNNLKLFDDSAAASRWLEHYQEA